jgi:hypothetical protein
MDNFFHQDAYTQAYFSNQSLETLHQNHPY